jgi:hypothetical protein
MAVVALYQDQHDALGRNFDARISEAFELHRVLGENGPKPSYNYAPQLPNGIVASNDPTTLLDVRANERLVMRHNGSTSSSDKTCANGNLRSGLWVVDP